MARTSQGVKVEIIGVKEMRETLEQLKQGVRNRVLRPALREAAKPMKAALKASVAAHSDTGTTAKSIDVKVSTSKRGNVSAIVGPRTKFQRTKQGKKVDAKWAARLKGRQRTVWPTKIFHLLERGAKPHIITPSKGPFKGRQIQHPGARARHHIARTVATTRGTAASILRTRIAEGIQREAAKYAAKGKTIYR